MLVQCSKLSFCPAHNVGFILENVLVQLRTTLNLLRYGNVICISLRGHFRLFYYLQSPSLPLFVFYFSCKGKAWKPSQFSFFGQQFWRTSKYAFFIAVVYIAMKTEWIGVEVGCSTYNGVFYYMISVRLYPYSLLTSDCLPDKDSNRPPCITGPLPFILPRNRFNEYPANTKRFSI